MEKREEIIRALIEQTMNKEEHTEESYRAWLSQFQTDDLEDMLHKVLGIYKRKIFEIAREIKEDWKNISVHAKPYLEAMLTMKTIDEEYGFDSGESIVRYFLSNASGYRGETARKIKAELKGMI